MVVPPVAPRTPAHLEPWGDDNDSRIEIDSQRVSDVDFVSAKAFSADQSELERITLLGAVLDKLELSDTKFSKVEFSAIRAYRAAGRRIIISDSRMSSIDFAEGKFEDCTFLNVKLDAAGFKFASFMRVHFKGCVLDNVDFTGAKLSQVRFEDCSLVGTNFESASVKHVDISREDITQCKGILGLKGATISQTQLLQLAPLLAAELGFDVKDEL